MTDHVGTAAPSCPAANHIGMAALCFAFTNHVGTAPPSAVEATGEGCRICRYGSKPVRKKLPLEPPLGRARLRRLRKDSHSAPFLRGHDFAGCEKLHFAKSGRA